MTGPPLPAPSAPITGGHPLVSVIVPCYGEGRYLDDCLSSIRNQTYGQLEIIVIDDAGTDDATAIALGHSSDPRVRVLRVDQNIGLGAIRNLGIDQSHGDLLAFVDGDDMLPPDSIRTRVATLASVLSDHAAADRALIAGVYGDWQYTTPDARIDQPVRQSAALGAIDLASSGGGNVFTVSAPLVRRDIMRLAGGFAPDVAGGEDLLGWRRVLELGVVFLGRERVVHLYRQKVTSMLRAAASEVAAFTAAARARVDDHGEASSAPIPIRRGMQRLRAFHDGAYPMPWGKPRRARTHMAAIGLEPDWTLESEAPTLAWTTRPPQLPDDARDFDLLVRSATSFLAGVPPPPPDIGVCHFLGHPDGVVASSRATAHRRRSHDVVIRSEGRVAGLRAGSLAARLVERGLAVAIASDDEARAGVLTAWYLSDAIPTGVVLAPRGAALETTITIAEPDERDEPSATFMAPPDHDASGLHSLLANDTAMPTRPGTLIIVDEDVPTSWLADAIAGAEDAHPPVVVRADSSSRARRWSDAGTDVRSVSADELRRADRIISASGRTLADVTGDRDGSDVTEHADLYMAQLVDRIGRLRGRSPDGPQH